MWSAGGALKGLSNECSCTTRRDEVGALLTGWDIGSAEQYRGRHAMTSVG